MVTAFAAGTRVFLNALSEGTAAIRVTASDSESLTTTQSFLVTVRANRPPEPVGRLAPVTLAVDDAAVTVEMSGAFRDPDGDTLTYGVTSSAPGIASVVVFGSSVIVTPVSEGTATVTVSATDAGGSNTPATQAFTVMVSPPANRPPEPVGALAPLRILPAWPAAGSAAALLRCSLGDRLAQAFEQALEVRHPLAELTDPGVGVRAPGVSVASEPPRQLDVEGVEVDVADSLAELGGSGVAQGLGQLVAPGLVLGLQLAELGQGRDPPRRPRLRPGRRALRPLHDGDARVAAAERVVGVGVSSPRRRRR